MSSSRRRFLRTLGAGTGLAAGLLAGLAAPRSARAGDVSVTARLSAARSEAGRAVDLVVEVTERDQGRRSMVSRPIVGAKDAQGREVPGMSFALTRTGSRSSFSFGSAGSVAEVVSTYTYRVVPQQAGSYRIDVQVEVDDRPLAVTPAPLLEVSGGTLPATADPSGGPGSDPGAIGGPTVDGATSRPRVRGRPQVFLRHVCDQEEVWVNQPLVYRYEIWERIDGRIEPVQLPTFKDFIVEELPGADTRRGSTADGTRYRVHTLMRRVLYPQRAGRLEVGAGQVRVTPQIALGLFSRPSGEPPFLVEGEPLVVTVKALPGEGRPPGFSPNNVGRFEVRSSVDRPVIDLGDALTWRIEVEGEGNLKVVDPGSWAAPDGLRPHDPQSSYEAASEGTRLGGKRSWERLLVAERPGRFELPAFTFPYFDPVRGQYVVARSAAIEIEVRGDPGDAEVTPPVQPPGVGAGGLGDEEELLVPPFTPERLPRNAAAPWPGLSRVTWRRLTWAAPLSLAAAYGLAALWRRLGPSEAARRRAQEAKWIASRLRAAEAAVASGEGFHGAVAELVQAAAMRRVGEAGVGRTREAVAELLGHGGVEEALVSRWQTLLDRCDAARFGAEADEPSARRALLDQARDLVDRLEASA